MPNQTSKFFGLLQFCLVFVLVVKRFVTDCKSFSIDYYKFGKITIIFTSFFIIRILFIIIIMIIYYDYTLLHDSNCLKGNGIMFYIQCLLVHMKHFLEFHKMFSCNLVLNKKLFYF